MMLEILLYVSAYYVVCSGAVAVYDRVEERVVRRSVARDRIGRLGEAVGAV